MAKTVVELQSAYDNLVEQRERILPEVARVSEDLAKARSVVLSEVDAFRSGASPVVALDRAGKGTRFT